MKIWHDLTILIAGQPSEQAASHQFLLHGFSDGSRYKSLTGGEQHEPSRIPWSVPAASSRSASQWNWRRGRKVFLMFIAVVPGIGVLCLALGCYPQTTQMAIWLEKSRIIYNVLYSIGMGGPLVQTKPCKIYWGSIISRAVPAWICCRHRKWKWNLDKLNGLALFLSVLHCRWARQHRFLPLKPWK